MRSVIVRPAPFQELWLSPETGIRPDKRLAIIFGRGRSPSNDVAADDVAEACVRLATMADPPVEIELGGPEAMTRQQVVDAFERAYGVRFRRISVPRPVLKFGARALRRRKPELASLFGMALARDLQGELVATEPLRRLGIEPRATSEAIAAMAGEAAVR
jgi:nucleoside-diphosphate-sugar epimerase